MKKPALVALFFALCVAHAYAACENLTCDPCPAYRAPNSTVSAAQPTSECVNINGKDQLNCACPPPPEGWSPAGRDAMPTPGTTPQPTVTPVVTTPAPNPNPTPQPNDPNANNDDGIDTIPPGGTNGSVIPTQSFGVSAATLISNQVSSIDYSQLIV